MEKRYQVFVSSTFRDLEDERKEVMQALLELDCIPSGMELFPAANETQWNLIKKVIDDCDYYLLIVGGRYGSVAETGMSYTQMEYEYALSTGKPTIAFLHKNPGKIVADKTESTEEGKTKLKEFRQMAEKKLCKHWETPEGLGSVVSRSLVQLIKSTPAVGWVRANELADREATVELLQLRRKVDELKDELAKARTSAPKGSDVFAQGSEEQQIRFGFTSTDAGYHRKTWTAMCHPTWDRIFSAISPLMIHEATDSQLNLGLNRLIEADNKEALNKKKELREQTLSGFHINSEDFHTVRVQLRALGFIAKSDKARSVKDADTYWTLTPYGDEVMTKLIAIRSADVPETDTHSTSDKSDVLQQAEE